MDITTYKPTGKINNKHMLNLLDYSSAEIYEILHLAIDLKAKQKANVKHNCIDGKTIAMIFAKSSTRTRVSFEQGIRQLGGYPMFLSSNDIQLGRGEPISDTVKTLERYNIDGIMIRTFSHSDVTDLAKYGSVPIINGLTDDFHPCQALADLLTVYENFGKLKDLKIAYFGDANNVSNSLMIAGAKCGMNVFVCTPKTHAPDKRILELAQKCGNITVTDNVELAAKDADVIYTDVFFSMGQENNAAKFNALMPYQVNSELMANAKKEAIFLHCLPAKRGQEVTAEVIDSKQSKVFDQAENRLHAQKSIMKLLISE